MKLPLFLLVLSAVPVLADPRLTSWFTGDSGRYARIYQSTAAETAGTVSRTWSRGAGVQSLPTYAGVSQVSSSADWVYIRTTGLAGHLMGPWYLDAAKTQDFPNFPSNNAKIYRIPRTPVIPTTKTLTAGGATGCMVNGVSMFDMRDTFSYVSASGTDATPVNGLTGDGVWNRDAYYNESVTFDAAFAHQAGNNYHYHAQPIALRYQLGDHVDYDPTTNRYTESAAPAAHHSPILAWAADGLPVYGPYGYADPLDPGSGVRRMISGFVPRNGASGTTNLTATGRTSLPAWAQRLQTGTFKNGPAVSTTYALGRYLEDFDYLGDHGYVQGTDFDLNEQNVRWCVTPEFPSGTWAYFTTIQADGTPAFPYTTGRQYFGSPTGGIATIAEEVTVHFDGGPNQTETAQPPTIASNGDVTLVWSAVEGGTYLVEATDDFADWAGLSPTVTATSDAGTFTEAGAKNSHSARYYRVTRTALATFDSSGFDYSTGGGSGGGGSTSTAPGGSAARGTTVTITITLPTTPPRPPAALVPTSVTLAGNIAGNIAGTSISRPSEGTVQATFAIPADAPTGAQNVVVAFNPAPTYTLTGGFTILAGAGGNAYRVATSSGSHDAPALTATALGETIAKTSTAASVEPAAFASLVSLGSDGSTSSARRGRTVTVLITLPTAPPRPPADLIPARVTLAENIAENIAGTSIARRDEATVQATFTIPAGAPTGPQTVVVTFDPGPSYPFIGEFTIEP